MKSSKILTYTALSIVTLVAGGFLLTTSVSADDSETLGERVRGMFMSEEEREAHQAEVDAELQEALESGDLTQEQYDLHSAVVEAHDELRQEREGRMRDELISKLEEMGYTVTDEDLDELRSVMQELGLGMMGQGRGMGKGMGGEMRGSCLEDSAE